MRALVWFRSDLRIDDNPALHQACVEAEQGVVAVFAVCSRQWEAHEWSGAKVGFILRSLAFLSSKLERLNIPLLFVRTPWFDGVPEALLRLARRWRCDALFHNQEYEVNELRRDAAVRNRFEAAGLDVQTFTDQVVIPPSLLRTGQGGYYTVFTPFRRAWAARFEEGERLRLSSRPKRQHLLICPPEAVPAWLRGFDANAIRSELWPAGEEHAHRRLAEFVRDRLDSYHETRDLPAVEGTSRLSPYLATGVISARRCMWAAIEANEGNLNRGRPGPRAWIDELIWREFYRHVLVGFPRVSMNRAFRPETEKLRWRQGEQAFKAWCHGRTGVPIVDAAMQQLHREGWMHNRLRMIAAMYLAKDLFIDWRWGERHFMRHLIDGDLASNNGGWQWAASTGTDAAPYFRIFNPYHQSRRFDPEGRFIRRYVPELRGLDSRAIHDPSTLPKGDSFRLSYPAPLCDHGQARRHAINAFKQVRRRSMR